MKHIKPGRGPSMQGGIIGIFMICFGIFWTVLAGSAFPPFAIFGILWTGIAVVNTVYNFKNANSKNRYQSYDVETGDTLKIYIEAEDSLGYIHKRVAYYWSQNDSGAVADVYYHGEAIYDKDGNMLVDNAYR